MTIHACIDGYTITDGTYDELLERTRDGLAPLLRSADGFLSCSVTDVGDEEFVATSAWRTREQAQDAAATSATWVSEHLGESVALRGRAIGEVTTLGGVQERPVTDLIAELVRRGAAAVRRPARTAAPAEPADATATADGSTTAATATDAD